MRLLAFDTCFDAVSAAVGVRDDAGQWTITDVFEAIGKGHAERLMPMLADVLAESGLQFSDIDKLAVTRGPGGFTGLRAGLAAARGLALATGKPLVAIGSLKLLGLGVAARIEPRLRDLPLAVVVDARKDEVYLQTFRSANDIAAITPPVLAKVADVATILPPEALVIAGSGAELLQDAGCQHASWVLARDVKARARDFVTVAAQISAMHPVMPIYLRPPDAKPQMSAMIARSTS